MTAMSALTSFSEAMVHAADLNNLSTNINSLATLTLGDPATASPSTKPACKVVQATGPSISSGSETPLVWSSAPLNTDGMWSSGSVLTVQTAGWYEVVLQVVFLSAAAAQRSALIFVNGTTDPTNIAALKDEYPAVAAAVAVQARLYDFFNVGDTIRGVAYQTTGSAVSLGASGQWGGQWLTAIWDGP